MMIGTIVESELGGPIHPSASGPSQPSSPTIQITENRSPASVSSRSENVRMKSRISAAISSSAIPISGTIPDSVASVYSSSTTAVETLVTRSGPSAASARSSIRRSMSRTRSSPVSSRRMLAIPTGVPSVSLPVRALSAAPISGRPRTESISACAIDERSSVPSTNPTSELGATIGSDGARSGATPGSARMSSRRASIWESPPGVSTSPRKTSVTVFTSL